MALAYKFDEVLEFPCYQDMRIIIDGGDEAKAKLMQALSEILQTQVTMDNFKEARPSKTGKYTSYTVRLQLQSAEQMENLYKEIVTHPFVKHII